MVPAKLTDRQIEIYAFMRSFTSQNGYPPAVREIADKFNICSPNGVMCHFKALEKKGYIERKKNTHRGIKFLI